MRKSSLEQYRHTPLSKNISTHHTDASFAASTSYIHQKAMCCWHFNNEDKLGMICWGWEETTAHDKMSLVCNGAICGVQHVGCSAAGL